MMGRRAAAKAASVESDDDDANANADEEAPEVDSSDEDVAAAVKPVPAKKGSKRADHVEQLLGQLEETYESYQISGSDKNTAKNMALLRMVQKLSLDELAAPNNSQLTDKYLNEIEKTAFALDQFSIAMRKLSHASNKTSPTRLALSEDMAEFVEINKARMQGLVAKKRKPVASKPVSTAKSSTIDYKKKKLERELNELIRDIGLDNEDNYMMIDTKHEIAPIAKSGAKTLKDRVNNFQYQVEDAQTCYDDALGSLRQAKKKFNSSYLNRNNLEELPDSEEPTYNDYLTEQAKSVKTQSKNFQAWKQSLANAQVSVEETEAELKEKLKTFEEKRVEWQQLDQPVAWDEEGEAVETSKLLADDSEDDEEAPAPAPAPAPKRKAPAAPKKPAKKKKKKTDDYLAAAYPPRA